MTRVPKFFNTAGPIQPDIHYNIDPLTRIDLEELESWMTEEGFRIAEVHGSYRYTVRPKNTMVHVTVEVPLWRGKK